MVIAHYDPSNTDYTLTLNSRKRFLLFELDFLASARQNIDNNINQKSMETAVLISAKIIDKNQAAVKAADADTAPQTLAVSATDVAPQTLAVSATDAAPQTALSSQTSAEKILEKSLHNRFKQYGKNAREWIEKCKLLLPEIVRRRIWEKRGFSSIYEYAAKLAGMSRSSVDNALWILRKAEDRPELKKVIEEKGINSVRPVLTIVTNETEGFWAGKARGMSRHALEVYVKEFQKVHMEAKNENSFCTGTKNYYENQDLFSDIKTETIQMEINSKTADELHKLKGAGNWDELMQKFIKMHKQQLEEQKPEIVQNASRHIPAAIKNYALAKTNGVCAFPNCSKPYKIFHHTDRFALTHAHNPDKLAPLCKAHEHLAHLGLIENEEMQTSEWRVRTAAEQGTEYENSAKFKIDQKVLKFRRAPE